MMNIFDLFDLVRQAEIEANKTSSTSTSTKTSKKSKVDEFCPLYTPVAAGYGFYCPSVSKVIFNQNATIVVFEDGTKSTVVKEPNDTYDRTTAVAYAIVKRALATQVNAKSNEVNAAYISTIRDLIANAEDQDKAAELKAQLEAQAQAKHEARQRAARDKAFERRVKARVKELEIEKAAQEILAGKKPLNESCTMTAEDFFVDSEPKTRTSGLCQIDSKDAWKLYKRPNKPFSEFTQAEKREYWRYQNAKRRAEGK